MDELMTGSCSVTTAATTTYDDNHHNNIYNYLCSSSLSDHYSFNYASHPFQEFMDCNHEEEQKNDEETKKKEGGNQEDDENEEEEEEEANRKKLKLKKQERKNLIIWDWDDTIFPTYSFRTHQDQKDKEFMYKLGILVSYIEKIFASQIKLYGSSNIIIVTNASETWINKCLNVDIVQDIFRNFQNLLKKYNIKTISASTREITRKFPKNHHKWKEVVFDRYFDEYFNDNKGALNRLNCITSIGDSLCEYEASQIASKYINNRILNRIRLKPNPSINDMIFQLKEISSIIHQFGSNLDDIEMDYSSLIPLSCSDTTC